MKFNLDIANINYIKIVYKDRDEQPHCTKAAIKRMGEREIFACAKFEEGLRIQTPQNIVLSFVCENGLYRTNTELKFIESEPPYIFFTLKTPDGLEYCQNRDYFRVRTDEDAILSFNFKEEKFTLACKVYDISASGVRLVLPERINEPEEAIIDILYTQKNIKLKAKFVRFDDEDNILKASFKFIDLSDNDMDIISQNCIRKQLEYRRKTFF